MLEHVLKLCFLPQLLTKQQEAVILEMELNELLRNDTMHTHAEDEHNVMLLLQNLDEQQYETDTHVTSAEPENEKQLALVVPSW